MRHILGFTDDYTKVTYGMRDTLQLIRKDDNDALTRTAAAGAGKVVLSGSTACKTKRCTQRVLRRTVQSLSGFGGVNVKRSLYLEQDPPSGDWVLALHQKSQDGYWLDCKQARVVTRKEMLPFWIIATS